MSHEPCKIKVKLIKPAGLVNTINGPFNARQDGAGAHSLFERNVEQLANALHIFRCNCHHQPLVVIDPDYQAVYFESLVVGLARYALRQADHSGTPLQTSASPRSEPLISLLSQSLSTLSIVDRLLSRTSVLSTPKGVEFAAVCEILSHMNHSCVPNIAMCFDVSSFAYTLYATRTIEAGKEITISYTQLIAPAATCQARLARYGFACICPSCTFHDASDQVHGWLANSLPPSSWVLWALLCSKLHYGLPDNKLMEIAHQIIQILKTENLQASPMYVEFLRVLGLLIMGTFPRIQ
ncbi:hypothetical protein EWM64_g6736 [Hericium alpestre]|uniref:SET domain-containing protein n=1 Tax=Hericium alpestre TaxID=135208 RepID=A0A4Y9ZT92_9AGAM|nr:hypothetical protein EWM64_g6736 [Hericium alpestre]